MQKGCENMNKIFKVIWSKSRNCYVVASELAKGTSKSTSTGRMAKRAALAAVAALLLFPAGIGTGFAAYSINTTTVTNASGTKTSVITGDADDAKAISGAIMRSVNNATDIGGLQDAMQSVEVELAQHQSVIDNLGTDKLTLSSDNTLQKESYDSTTKTTTTTDATGLKVAGPISAESGKITNSLEVGNNVNVGGAVNAGSVNSRGNLNVDGNALVKGTLTSQSTINGKEIVSQTNITANNKVVGMKGVVDNTLTGGNYVTAGNTVGENIVALDTQVKANADAIGEEARKRKYSVTNLENADKQLQTNIDNEAAARKAADDALDSRTTALEDKTEAITYDKDSKTVMVDGKLTATEGITDGTMQDGKYVKLDKYVGQNLNALDQGLQAETSARVTADAKLAEAVNNGLSLGDGNVLQKNTTSVAEDGTVTTSKTEANEMILNKGKDNQITLNENGIKVGTNSSVMDKDGVYTGGDTYSEAKTAMSADGKIKGANGAFTVDENGNVTSKATITGETVTDGKGASMSNGTVTGKTLTDGIATITNGNINTSGTITGGTVTSTGNISALGDIHAGGAITGASASIQGALTAGSATITGDLTAGGAIQGKSISDGTATMQNGNLTGVKNLSAETITTSGDATIGGDLTVKGKLNVDEIDLTKSGIVGDNNVTASTKVAAGEITSYKRATSTKDGSEKESAIDYDENGTSTWAKATDADGKWNKSTLTVEGSDVTSKVIDSDKNSNLSTQTSTESNSTLKDKDGKTSTFNQRVDEILNQINSSDTVFSKVDQKVNNITSEVTDGTNTTSSTQTTTDITNTAKQGTITNEAQKLVNKASDTISNEATNNITNTSTNGNISNTANNGTISNTAKNIENTASENITNTAKNGSITNDAKNIANIASETLSNRAKNITNTTTDNMTNTIGKNLTTTVGGDMSTEVTGNQSNTVKGTLTETVTGKAIENYNGGLETTITGEEKHTVNGTQTNNITGDQTNTIGGNQTTTVTGDSSLTAENINNTASNKITNKAIDVETDASSSIVSKVSNEYGSNTSTQLSYQTTEGMSQADGKKASYLRGAAEEKSQLTDGDKKTTIDTIAGQTNTNITEGKNISNSLQNADKIASSVTDGTNTTVVNQDAKSLASSITNGTKANNTNSTVDASVQRIQTDDTHYSVSSKSASKMEDALFNGSTVIDSLKDAEKGLVSTAVTDGINLTGSTMTAKGITNSAAESIVNEIGDGSKVKSEMTAKGITNTAKDGTITNDAKDVLNKGTNSVINEVGNNQVAVTTDSVKAAYGSDTYTTWDASGITSATSGDMKNSAKNITNTASETLSNSAKNISNTAAEKLSNSAAEIENKATTSINNSVGDNVSSSMTTSKITESVKDGTKSNTFTKTADKDINIVTDGTSTSTLSQLAGSVNTSLKEVDGEGKTTKSLNNVQTVSEDTTKITDTASGGFSSRSQKADGFTSQVKNGRGGSNTVTDTAITSEQQLVSGNIIDILKDADNGWVKTTVKTSDNSSNTSVNQGTADITNTAKQGTITNDAKNLVNKAEEKLSNSAVEIENTATTSIKDVVGKSKVTTTDAGTTFENAAHATVIGEGTITKTTISGNTLETGKVTADYVDVNKDLSVGGSATVTGDVTAKSYKIGNKTYISESVINANDQKVVYVAPGRIAADSKDAINGSQLYQTNERVTGVENKVNKLDSRVDKVGANAAALANLHPLEFDADSKWNIAAAVGGYKGETATAIGAFYRPNENVMVNVSSSFGTGENMYGGGISLRIGQGGNKARRNATNGLTEREKAMQKQIDSLTSRLDALLSVINPNMSKDFPDVPENHWAYEAVSRLAGNGVIQGYEDGKYHGDRTMTRYEMAEIIYNALSKGAKAEKKLVEEFKPELQAMAAQKKA